ncbi:MAG: hypothetical protein U0930_23225, partial [Pirellulales bacterium]
MTQNKTCNGSCQPSCCESTPPTTVPMSVHNPAGLSVLRGRVGDHRSFFESLRRRLSSQQYPHLSELTTRSLSDPAIALLDSWAVVGDVLTLYNERYLQEAYHRTATEVRSLQELSKLIGYRPGPGVASSVYLAFTLEKSPEQASQETLIKNGTKVQSVPGADESAQTFETMENLVARPEWSAIRPRLTIPQSITESTVEQIDTVTFDGISTKLLPNDLILFVFADGGKRIKRYVRSVQPNADFSSTTVSLIPTTLSARQLVDDVRQSVRDFVLALPAVSSMTFLRYLKAEVERFGSFLTPEAGLVALDTACVDESGQWRDFNLAIDSSDVKLSAVISAFDLDGFVADAHGTFGNTIDAFLTDQAKLPTVVTLLKEAWGDAIAGNGGISDDIPVSAMQAKVKTAIGAAGTGITGAISTWTGVLKLTADKLVSDLGVIAAAVIPESPAARRQFRKDYVKWWATFTDQSQGAFESKRNTTADTEYDPSKFETLVSGKLGELKAALAAANPDFVVIADGIKDARRTTTSIGWLARTGLSSAATPLELRIRFDFAGGAAPDTVGPVVAQGLFDRLAKDPGGGVDTVASIFEERDDTLTQIVDNAKDEHLETFSVTPSFEALEQDLNDVGTRIQSIPTSAAAGAFATPVAQLNHDCLELRS